jgi:4-amino-4-deoxy-L-arabinose transferase-like glycosyltransferase
MEHDEHRGGMANGYRSLAVQTLISGVIMYLVMFVMIDGLDSFYNNLNMLYMTVMMVAPMVVLMIVAMPHMFRSRTANGLIIGAAAITFLGAFALIRTQTTIGDRAFLRSTSRTTRGRCSCAAKPTCGGPRSSSCAARS